MAKTGQQRLNEFWAESDLTRAALKSFSDAAYENYGSHAYAAGYLESSLASVIMSLPKKQRQELRAEFERAALKQREAAMLNNIKESA